jgi:hypothetical protein
MSLLHGVQICSGAHPSPSTVGTGAYLPDGKAARREAGSSPSSVEFKNGEITPPLPSRLCGVVLN